MSHKSGFVSILGRPNAGKSTLLNALVGQKVSIVADKPQTTRTAIQGVVTTPEAQIILVDTPGIHKSSSAINKRMMDSVRASLEERDLLVYVVDATKPFSEEDERAVSVLRRNPAPAILAFNKIDALKAKQDLLPLMEEYPKHHDFAEYLPISAETGVGVEKLRGEIVKRLPEGPEYFPEDHVTDQPARFLAAELIREKILLATRQEVPHATTVAIDQWEETERLIRIHASIVVEREGQKGIVIGKRGSMLKEIGTLARQEMEALFGIAIYLDLHVKVEAAWRENRAYLDALDWRTMAGRDDT
ncbi:MAG: GTPase Era [Acidobacteriota bacterium]|nr:GTPase Era [Acidobacteriota bacterium]